MRIKAIITAAVLALSSVGGVSAATLSGPTGLNSPVTTIAFSEIPGLSAGTVITDQFAEYGVTFGSLSGTEGLYLGYNGNPGADLWNYFPTTNPFSIKFSGTVT